MPTYTSQPDGTSGIDAHIASDVPNTNRGTVASADVGEYSGAVGRMLLKFDLSSIPSSAVVSSATLTLTPVGDYSSNARTLSVYRCLRAWTEAGVTWNKYDGTNAWGTAGADNTTSDRESSAIGTLSVGASPTLNTGMDITLTASKIQEMVSGTFTNNGFVIRVDTENADDIQWATSDHATAGYRPKLVIEYSLPSGVAVASLSDYGII